MLYTHTFRDGGGRRFRDERLNGGLLNGGIFDAVKGARNRQGMAYRVLTGVWPKPVATPRRAAQR